jgi:hypothetical protein
MKDPQSLRKTNARRLKRFALLILSASLAGAWNLPAQEPAKEVRTIKLLQDDAQVRFASRLYELKYTKPTDVRPFILAAVTRYNARSQVDRVNNNNADRHYLLVTTGEDFIPYVDKLIAGLDVPGKADAFGSVIEGTGVTRVTYHPNYRLGTEMLRIINAGMRSPEGTIYLNEDTNTIFWKDDRAAANAALNWIKYLDRPLPQVNLKLKYYEIRESKLRDIGLDYLAWKNGPGLDIFSAGFDTGKIFSSEAVFDVIGGVSQLVDLTKDFSSSWGYGGFFTAPKFDLSFVRLLQQSGNAKLAAEAELTFVNTPVYETEALNTHLPKVYKASLTPGYENLTKDDDDRSSVVTGGDSSLTLSVINPVICFGATPEETTPKGQIPSSQEFYEKNDGGVVFAYKLVSKSVTERSNRGDELGDSATVGGELTLGFKTEKLLASYVKENDVEQTIGIPFLVKIPVLKYLFGTTTSIKERTYIVVTAEASLVHPDGPIAAAEPVVESDFGSDR